MVRDLGFQLVQATREIAEMNDCEETMRAAVEDKRLLSEELMYCEDLLLT